MLVIYYFFDAMGDKNFDHWSISRICMCSFVFPEEFILICLNATQNLFIFMLNHITRIFSLTTPHGSHVLYGMMKVEYVIHVRAK